ncbi:MAG: hypothetical protein OXN20_17885 [Gemmatimonadota bacterium]|nr:hypothetical protein [Gemmatimonadota bacterium]
MCTEHNVRQAIAILVTTALLLNAMMPTLAHAATYLQGVEANANTLVRDAYVRVIYRDHNGQEKTERGWIDAVGETSFTIRSGHWTKKTITYAKVLSVIMSEESTTLKQMNEVNRFIGERKKEEELKAITVMSRGQIDPAKITKRWYAHAIYMRKKIKKTATGKIIHKDSDRIVIQNREEFWKSWKIAYSEIDRLAIAKHQRDIEGWMVMQLLHEGNAKVRARIPSIQKQWMIGKVEKMTQDTLVVRGELALYGRKVPLSSISDFEVNIGQHRNTGKGSIFGLALGLAILAPVVIADARDEDEWQRFATIVTATFISLPIWVLSTIIGATIKTDKWVEVPPQRLNLSVAPTSAKGLRAALTFNF